VLKERREKARKKMKAASSHEFKVQYVKEHKNFKAKPLRF